jgi:hypothetical protein
MFTANDAGRICFWSAHGSSYIKSKYFFKFYQKRPIIQECELSQNILTQFVSKSKYFISNIFTILYVWRNRRKMNLLLNSVTYVSFYWNFQNVFYLQYTTTKLSQICVIVKHILGKKKTSVLVLDAFAKLRKVTISFVTSGCPSVCRIPRDVFSRNWISEDFPKSAEKIRLSL